MCDVCEHNPCLPRCPNYFNKVSFHYCSICGEGIVYGEEYIEYEPGHFIHFDCIRGLRHLLSYLGYKIKTMEDFNEK